MSTEPKFDSAGFDRLHQKVNELNERSNKLYESRLARAKALCKASGLDPELLGIHPHNATVSRNNGKPWPGVDYALVAKCQHELHHLFDARDLVHNWYRKNYNRYCFK